MLIRKLLKSKLKSNNEAPVAMTSTPNASGEAVDITPDVSIIERTCSSPVLISAESMEDLEIEFFDRLRVSALHPGTRIVQRAGQSILSPTTTARQKAKKKTDSIDNNLSYLQHLATELQKSAKTLSKMQSKNSASNLREPSEETNQSSFTRSCGEVAGKLTKCSSPFKENCSLQTFQTAARQTSPLQLQTTDACYKTTAQQCPRSLAHSNLTVICPEHRNLRPIPSLSCPSTPRDSRRACARSRSRSHSPDLISETLRRTNTLRDIIQKITTTLSNGDPKSPQISRAEAISPTRATPPRFVHFTPRPASAGACPPRGDVKELYFNKGMKNNCKPCTPSFEPPDFQPCMHKAEKNPCQPSVQTGACPGTCRCKPRQSTQPPACSSCQLPKPSILAPCPVPPPCGSPCPVQPAYPRGNLQLPCKADTGLSGTESMCSVNSASCVNEAKRAQYLQNKLHATQLCLKNKEETVRVQAESLTCAEQRIALLTVRAAQQRRELDTVQRELIKLKGCTFETADGCCQARCTSNDVCCSTLANPCQNTDAGCQLEGNTEECIDTCTLKRENNNLRELNQGLEMSSAWKTIPKFLFSNIFFRNSVFVVYPVSCVPKCKINDLCEQKAQLECTIRERDDTINCLRRENDELCCEMRGLRCELEAAKKRICEIQNETGCVRKQLTQAQEEVGEVKSEICRLERCNEELTRKNKLLSEELERADDIIKENCKIRSEVAYLTQQVALWRQQLAESEERVHCVEAELARARSHCRNVDQCYREKVDVVAALEVQLQQAHSRGAQLCAESRRVVGTVRNWIHRMQQTTAEQCQKIKAQQSFIEMLQKALQDRIAEDHIDTCPPPPPPENPFPRESEDTIETAPCGIQETEAAQDLDELVQESCDYYSNYRAHLQSQTPFGGVGCSKCAAKRPADPSRSPTDDSDDVVPVGCNKSAPPPKRKSSSKALISEITIDFQVGCSKCAPKRINRARKDTNEETESGSGRSQATSTAKSYGCEQDDGVNQVSRALGCSPEASCSNIPLPPRRLLRKKLCQDRVAHYLYMQRCTAAPVRSAGVQEPARRDSCTQPCSRPCASPHSERRASRQASRIPMPRALSPTGELLERVSLLSDAMEDSQRRWSRSKLPQEHR